MLANLALTGRGSCSAPPDEPSTSCALWLSRAGHATRPDNPRYDVRPVEPAPTRDDTRILLTPRRENHTHTTGRRRHEQAPPTRERSN